jgi:exodeoxyribonuclease VII large subunit
METIDISQSQEIFTVSRLNREVRFILEGNFATLWIEGEVSNFSAPQSGHWYFSLKDASAQVRCAMFKLQNRKLGFTPKDGMHIMIKAKVSLYEGRGEFQLIAEYMEEVGEGKLRLAFEALKKRLQEQGLFDTKHKKDFPLLPKTLGVITSPTGAAIRDILSVLKRRFPALPIIIYPTMVQGDLAAPNIVSAVQAANRRKECDVLILARGGGSLEDLWPFNEEIVAQAIFNSQIPIMSGVGHEVDFTIADFVADQRAPTPSAAAELVTPDSTELLQAILQNYQRLLRYMRHCLQQLTQNLNWMDKHLQQQHPKRRLREQAQRLDHLEMALMHLQQTRLSQLQNKFKNMSMKLSGLTPKHQIHQIRNHLILQQHNLQSSLKDLLQQRQQTFSNIAATLDALSPLSTLKRGYAIATKDNKVLRKVEETKPGDNISVQLHEGSLSCVVENITSS